MVIDKRQTVKWLAALGALVLALSACGPGGTTTPAATRVVTQTPWIIYVPVTLTPQPATVTPLPTVTSAVARTATRTPTRPAATKAAVATPRPTTAPVVVVPPPTAAPACTASSVTLTFPKDGDPRRTKTTGPASDTFVFKWTPFQAGESDPTMGYRIDIESRKGTTKVNGDGVYVGHNWFLSNGQQYIYTADRIFGLAQPAGGDDVTVLWKVTVIKTTGGFDNQGRISGSEVNCSAPSQTSTIQLLVIE